MTDPLHSCPGGCGAGVPHHLYACRSCWRRLPYRLRLAITAAYGRDPYEHRRALANAQGWYAAHPLN